MFAAVTPRSLMRRQASSLSEQLTPILDGDVDGVHDARIATRRIRELLPLTGEWHRPDVIDTLYVRFRTVGRALGEVRDADVRILLLKHLEARIPTAAPSVVIVRQVQERRRLELMRKLIKQLEADELPELIREAAHGSRLSSGWWRAQHRWKPQLHAMLAQRALGVKKAVRHATGVYFPNRAHSARIAIKKFRYALEIAQETNTVSAHDALRALKGAQNVLGDLHDRQALLDDLEGAPSSEEGNKSVDQMALVVQVVEAEIRDLHTRYLARRDRLLIVADDAARAQHGVRVVTPLMLAAGALAVSSGLVAAGHHTVSSRHSDA